MSGRFFAVILAGGKGERFWPLSTHAKPKQMHSLVGGKPLIVEAVARLKGLVPPDRTYVITSDALVPAVRRMLPGLPGRNVVGEPCGRDTAAAVALGAALVSARDPAGVFCVVTADHVIGDLPVFRRTLRACLETAARQDVLITIGIKPSRAHTGFGYIETAGPAAARQGVRFFRVRRFTEKPDLRTAERYASSGKHYWNSGMFVWSAASVEMALARHRPALAALLRRLRTAARKPRFASALKREYRDLEKISIDYALMEKADNILMARGVFAWDDVGAWTALANHLPRDARGNVCVGSCEAMDSSANIVVSGERLTALIGVRNLVVIQAPRATLVCPRDRAQDVRRIVRKLQADGRHRGVL